MFVYQTYHWIFIGWISTVTPFGKIEGVIMCRNNYNVQNYLWKFTYNFSRYTLIVYILWNKLSHSFQWNDTWTHCSHFKRIDRVYATCAYEIFCSFEIIHWNIFVSYFFTGNGRYCMLLLIPSTHLWASIFVGLKCKFTWNALLCTIFSTDKSN